MHLWPSMRLRESFKHNYLKKLEWNLSKMNSEKDQSNNNQTKLLDDNDGSSSNSSKCENALLLCRELLMILSCCYCCFCCGVSKVIPALEKTHLSGKAPYRASLFDKMDQTTNYVTLLRKKTIIGLWQAELLQFKLQTAQANDIQDPQGHLS
ncbi:hypothetical protein LguiB_003337 [Lonicera macranthoides]